MVDESAYSIATRAEAEAFLDDRIGQGVKPGLDRIAGLLDYMGDPQSLVPMVHIAGTNGKTTVARMVQQILGAHGLSTAGFTSPHLGTVEERFTLHGAPIDADRFTETVRDIAWFVTKYEEDRGESTTYFEATAALAFSLMAAEAVDVGVVEVGLGGRLDATNVIEADVSVITGIDIDHTEFLGSTIEEITREKVAILKPGGTLVTGALPDPAVEPVADRVADSARTSAFGTPSPAWVDGSAESRGSSTSTRSSSCPCTDDTRSIIWRPPSRPPSCSWVGPWIRISSSSPSPRFGRPDASRW